LALLGVLTGDVILGLDLTVASLLDSLLDDLAALTGGSFRSDLLVDALLVDALLVDALLVDALLVDALGVLTGGDVFLRLDLTVASLLDSLLDDLAALTGGSFRSDLLVDALLVDALRVLTGGDVFLRSRFLPFDDLLVDASNCFAVFKTDRANFASSGYNLSPFSCNK
jgi:hypothetical protein